MSRADPITIQLALSAAHGVATRLLEEEGRLPLFALFHRGGRAQPLVAVLRWPASDEATALASLRDDAPAIARGHDATAVTLGGAGMLARGSDSREAQAIWQGLRAGTLDDLSDVPGARPVLLLEHHVPGSLTRAAFPLYGSGLGAQQLFAQTFEAGATEPFAGIRFFGDERV